MDNYDITTKVAILISLINLCCIAILMFYSESGVLLEHVAGILGIIALILGIFGQIMQSSLLGGVLIFLNSIVVLFYIDSIYYIFDIKLM